MGRTHGAPVQLSQEREARDKTKRKYGQPDELSRKHGLQAELGQMHGAPVQLSH